MQTTSVNNRISNATYTLSHNCLQEGCINFKYSPGDSSFLVEYVMQVFVSRAMNGYLPTKKSIIEHVHLLSNVHYFLYIDYRTDHTFSTLITKAQPVQPLYYINVITELL